MKNHKGPINWIFILKIFYFFQYHEGFLCGTYKSWKINYLIYFCYFISIQLDCDIFFLFDFFFFFFFLVNFFFVFPFHGPPVKKKKILNNQKRKERKKKKNSILKAICNMQEILDKNIYRPIKIHLTWVVYFVNIIQTVLRLRYDSILFYLFFLPPQSTPLNQQNTGSENHLYEISIISLLLFFIHLLCKLIQLLSLSL